MTTASAPRLSVIAVFYNMAREAPRTLYSLSAEYQRGVTDADYEVIAVDNGSAPPLSKESVTDFGGNFRLLTMADAPPSPAAAINHGVAQAAAPHVGILIDGARMSSPGMIRAALDALEAFPNPVVSTVGFHLGPDMQTRSPAAGYSQAVEDRLLDQIQWKENGYRLFENSALAGSSRNGWFGVLAESNLLFLPRRLFDALGGYDERFDLPGGGFVNLDFYKKACESAGSTLITLLGEATFHQIHGGIMTNRPQEKLAAELERYRAQYRAIRGEDFVMSRRRPQLYGQVRPEVRRWFDGSAGGAQAPAPRKTYTREEVDAAREKARGDGVIQRAASAPQSGDHRSYVGPDDYYDKVAALQFGLLTMLGMRESDTLLDIGCGALRGGRLFLPYLAKGHYFGLEPNPWLIEQAIEKEIGADQIALKAPEFRHNDDFDLTVFGRSFDFMMAHSIFSHTGLSQFDACMKAVAATLAEDGVLAATFVDAKQDAYKDEWEYPGFNRFAWSTLKAVIESHGLFAAKLDWPHPLQSWIAVVRDPARLIAIEEAGVDLLPDDLILTGPRFLERGKGRFLSFYRHYRERARSDA